MFLIFYFKRRHFLKKVFTSRESLLDAKYVFSSITKVFFFFFFCEISCSRSFVNVNPINFHDCLTSQNFLLAKVCPHKVISHFNFAVLSKIKYFVCVIFRRFRNSGKSKKASKICIFCSTSLIHKSIENIGKSLSGLKISSSSSLSLQLTLKILRLESFSSENGHNNFYGFFGLGD